MLSGARWRCNRTVVADKWRHRPRTVRPSRAADQAGRIGVAVSQWAEPAATRSAAAGPARYWPSLPPPSMPPRVDRIVIGALAGAGAGFCAAGLRTAFFFAGFGFAFACTAFFFLAGAAGVTAFLAFFAFAFLRFFAMIMVLWNGSTQHPR